MDDDFDFLNTPIDMTFDELIEEIDKLRPKRKSLTYEERMEQEAKVREAKAKSKEAFHKIKVSKDVAEVFYKVSEYIAGHNDLNAHEKADYLEKADQAFNDNDLSILDAIYDEIQQLLPIRNLNWYKERILKSIGCNISEIEDILNDIQNDREADFVLASVQGSDWITKLPKEYPVKFIYSNYTYKDQVRLHRRMLEKDLQGIGVGINRSRRISQILFSI